MYRLALFITIAALATLLTAGCSTSPKNIIGAFADCVTIQGRASTTVKPPLMPATVGSVEILPDKVVVRLQPAYDTARVRATYRRLFPGKKVEFIDPSPSHPGHEGEKR